MGLRHLNLLLALSCLPACLSTGPFTCESATDCYKDQFCVQGVCSDDETGDPSNPADACQDFSMTACPDPDEAEDRNDERNEATPLNRGERWGCNLGDLTTPEPIELSSVLCPDETGDFYQVGFTECRDSGFEVIATLTTTPICGPDIARLRAYINGKELLCGDEDNPIPLDCDDEQDGVLVRGVTIDGSGVPSIGALYFGVDGSDQEAVRFGYDLQVRFEELE